MKSKISQTKTPKTKADSTKANLHSKNAQEKTSKTYPQKDNSATRVLLIIKALVGGKDIDKLDSKDFDFAVSKRTFQRDLKRVREFFAENDLHGGKVAKYVQKFAQISGIKALYPTLDECFLTELLEGQLDFVSVKENAFESVGEALFERLSNAILQRQKLAFTYKQKVRIVKPYELSHIQGVWYLIADEDGVLKHFAVSKLVNIDFLPQFFRQKAEFAAQIKAQKHLWLTTNPQNATICVSLAAKEYFLRKELPKNFHIIKNSDEALLVRVYYAFEDELFKIVKTWLPYIKITQPTHLQGKFNEILKGYLGELWIFGDFLWVFGYKFREFFEKKWIFW